MFAFPKQALRFNDFLIRHGAPQKKTPLGRRVGGLDGNSEFGHVLASAPSVVFLPYEGLNKYFVFSIILRVLGFWI